MRGQWSSKVNKSARTQCSHSLCRNIHNNHRKVHHGHNGRNTHTRGHLVVPFFSSSPYYCRKFHGPVFNNFQLPFNCPSRDHLVCQVSITFNCDQVQCQNFNGSSQFSICLYHPFPLLLSPLSGYVNDKIENRII